jgi:CO/xanthine dehydrogenase Mo-binding subunit
MRCRSSAPLCGGVKIQRYLTGAKVGADPEDVIVAYLAMQLGQPINWVATRAQDMSATFHGRRHAHRS